MTGFLLRMPAGIPGDVNRAEQANVEAQVITPYGTTGAPPAYGVAILIDATTGQVRIPATGDTVVHGFLVRPYPVQENTASPTLGSGTPPTSGACSILKRGYMSVLLQNTTAAAKEGIVYVRVTASGSLVAGGVEAAAGSGIIALANAYFTGPADSNGITEICVGSRSL